MDGAALSTRTVAIASPHDAHSLGSPALHLDDVSIAFATANGGDYVAVRNASLVVAPGEFVSVVGPTGSGKSTLLNAAAGLLAPRAGTVSVFGRALRGLNRDAAYLFQADVLMPWKTALDNVALGPEAVRRMPRPAARTLAAAWLGRVGLAGLGGRYPHQLSGGQRKRVAIAQTLILDPKILLMDEPFSALDAQTRAIMENELLALWERDRKSVLLVTHDLEEAISLSDRVVLLSAGPGARVVGDYKVTLPRPRDVAEIRLTPGFIETYRRIWSDLKAEVMKTYAAAPP